MNRKLLFNTLPVVLLMAFLIRATITVFTQADTFGLTLDEPLQDAYGQSALAWYKTWGRDTSFLTSFPPEYHMAEHGVIFEVIVAEAQVKFGQRWHTRAVINGLAAVAGLVAIALCGFELGGGWWGALLAAIGLWYYPRFFGAIFNNSKDIPFTSLMTLVLWAVLLFVRQWQVKRRYFRNSILVGFLIGLAAAVRINAITWYPLLALLLVGWWIYNGRRVLKEQRLLTHLGKQAIAASLIITLSSITMIVLWPYVAMDPLHNLYSAIMIMRTYPWDGAVPFAGHVYQATSLPRSYAPVWLVIGSPPAVVIFAGIGGLFASSWLVMKKMIAPNIAVVSLALMVPLGMIVVLRPTLYDSLRQFLFLVPPLLLLATYGFMSLFAFLMSKKQKLAVAGLVLLALAGQWQVMQDMHALHPYEYMYFSPFIGGVAGAKRRFAMDYWGVCNKPAAEWLAHNYKKYTHKTSPTIAANVLLVMTYLPGVFHLNKSNPDFYATSTRSQDDFPSYKLIHTEGVQGYVACIVKARPPSAR